MEITFELEDSNIVVDFEPDFGPSINCTDIEKVQWSFQDGTHTGVVASLLGSTPEHEHPPTRLLPIVRLCDRCNEDIIR